MRTSQKLEKVETLIRSIAADVSSPFYARAWGRKDTYASVPALHASGLEQTPLEERRYRRGVGFVRIILRGEGHALVKILQKEARIRLSLQGERPLILCADEQLALESMVRCYGSLLLPLLGEMRLLRSSLIAASRYECDVALCDMAGALALAASLHETPLPRLRHLWIYSEGAPESGDLMGALQHMPASVESHPLLSLPEAGSLGTLCLTPSGTIVVHEADDIYLDGSSGILRATTLDDSLATPLIKYETAIPVREIADCERCGSRGFELSKRAPAS